MYFICVSRPLKCPLPLAWVFLIVKKKYLPLKSYQHFFSLTKIFARFCWIHNFSCHIVILKYAEINTNLIHNFHVQHLKGTRPIRLPAIIKKFINKQLYSEKCTGRHFKLRDDDLSSKLGSLCAFILILKKITQTYFKLYIQYLHIIFIFVIKFKHNMNIFCVIR